MNSKKSEAATERHDRQLSGITKSPNFSKTPPLPIPPAEGGMPRGKLLVLQRSEKARTSQEPSTRTRGHDDPSSTGEDEGTCLFCFL